jgi:hypothetical protein
LWETTWQRVERAKIKLFQGNDVAGEGSVLQEMMWGRVKRASFPMAEGGEN